MWKLSLSNTLVEWMTMEAGVAGLIRVFDSLSPDEQYDAIQKLNEYISADSWTRERLVNESQRDRIAKRVDLGPVSGVCPYCGR